MKKIKKDTYWEWRFQTEKMYHEQSKVREKRKFNAMMEKDIEIAKLKNSLYKQQIKNQEDSCREAAEEYNEMKSRMEKEIGMSLDGCSIDDITLEVRELEVIDENSK
jgi:molecular chaperone GrpE (heat shock protein)